MRTYEKLMGSDKVDLVLPPWGSNANFAVAPLANRFGYPVPGADRAVAPAGRDEAAVLLPAAAAARADDATRWSTCSRPTARRRVAVIYVDDLFGLENYAALKVALQGSGITLVRGQELPAAA